MTESRANPANYQEQVKAREFRDFLKQQEILSDEILSRQGSSTDSDQVKGLLHYGVKLLISNSKATSRKDARRKFEGLLVKQARMYEASMLGEVEALQRKISDFLLDDQKTNTAGYATAENLEIDFYMHGWVEGPLIQVTPSHSEIMGIRADVIPLHVSTPEARPILSVQRPQKITPFAKGDSNVVNVGEAAGTSDDCLPKKVAQLERALTYARYRAGKEDIEEVVGYGALCMSMIDGASLASVIISLHPDIFPLLARMQKKGGLAYLLSSRTIYEDMQRALEHYGGLEEQLKSLEQMTETELKRMTKAPESFQSGQKLTIWVSCLSLGIALVSLLARRT